MKLTKKISLLLLILSVLVTLVFRVLAVSHYNFPFTMDQGRDMVDLRHMVVTHSPRLVGPTTSINGVLLGPAWYYFLLPAFLLGHGDPSALLLWQIIFYQLAGVFLWYVFSQKNIRTGLVISVLFLFMPIGFYANRYFWNANAMLIFTAIFFGYFYLSLEKPDLKNQFFNGLFAGLAMQIEAAFGILFFPFAFIYLLLKKSSLKSFIGLISGFALTLAPQAVFELRHGFVMTRVLLAEFTGKAAVLGEKISFGERLSERYTELMRRIAQLSHVHPTIINLIVLASILTGLYLLFQRKSSSSKKNFVPALLFLFLASIFYLLFSQHLKGWYVLGISIPLIILVGSSLGHWLDSKSKILVFASILFIFLHIGMAIKEQYLYLNTVRSQPSKDPSNLKNELTVLDWVYQKASGRGFRSYNYIPSVYDYNYHYLYWWYGEKKYSYQPFDVAYLPDQPEYIQDNALLWQNIRHAQTDSPTFLVSETDAAMPDRESSWRGHFSNLCLIDKIEFPFRVNAQELQPCRKNK